MKAYTVIVTTGMYDSVRATTIGAYVGDCAKENAEEHRKRLVKAAKAFGICAGRDKYIDYDVRKEVAPKLDLNPEYIDSNGISVTVGDLEILESIPTFSDPIKSPHDLIEEAKRALDDGNIDGAQKLLAQAKALALAILRS